MGYAKLEELNSWPPLFFVKLVCVAQAQLLKVAGAGTAGAAWLRVSRTPECWHGGRQCH